MEKHRQRALKSVITLVLGWLAVSGFSGLLTPRVNAQPPAPAAGANLPAGVVEVVKLTKTGASEALILARVRKAGVSYDLTTDQVNYLNSQRVAETVIAALLHKPEDKMKVGQEKRPNQTQGDSEDCLAQWHGTVVF